MLKRVHVAPRVGAASLILVAALAACNEEKKSTTADTKPIASNNAPVLGGKLGQAVAAAQSAAPMQPADKPKDGPPDSGIFASGAADAAQALNAPPKLQLMNEGSEPKLPLAYAVSVGAERKATVLLQVRAAQSAITPLTVALVFKSEKPKDDKKAGKDKDKDKDKDKPAEPVGLPVTVTIAEVKSLRGGSVGGDLENFKDVVLKYRLQPNGVPTDLNVEFPKKSSDAIELMTSALIDVVLGLTVPLPDKPVGMGAYWMVSDRAHSSGVDVVRYRVAKVTKIEDKSATVSIDVRQYAVNPTFALPGMPKEIQVSLEKYESVGKGEATLGPDAFLPGKGQINVAMSSELSSPQQQQPGQHLAIQTDIRAALSNTP